MRYIELTNDHFNRQKQIGKEAESKKELLRLMYANFDHIYRDQSHLLSVIDQKIDDLQQLQDKLELEIDKSELSFAKKEKVRKLAQKRIQKIIGR